MADTQARNAVTNGNQVPEAQSSPAKNTFGSMRMLALTPPRGSMYPAAGAAALPPASTSALPAVWLQGLHHCRSASRFAVNQSKGPWVGPAEWLQPFGRSLWQWPLAVDRVQLPPHHALGPTARMN